MMMKHAMMVAALTGAGAAPAQTAPTGVTLDAAQVGALSQQAYHALIAFAEARKAKRPSDSVVLAAGAPLVKGSFVPCGTKPLAVVFALDGAVTRGGTAVPGVGHAVDDLRKLGMVVVFTGSGAATTAPAVAATLATLKLGPVAAGETLFLAPPGPGDAQRLAIAARYCVIAMAGARLGDFSDRFADAATPDATRAVAVHSRAAGEWGKGWFLLPPVS